MFPSARRKPVLPDHIEIETGEMPLRIRLRADPRARRYLLRLPADASGPVLTIPGGGDLARAERFAPGDGQIDLAAYLRALPKDIPLGLEVPRPVPSEMLPQELAHIAQATRALLAQL